MWQQPTAKVKWLGLLFYQRTQMKNTTEGVFCTRKALYGIAQEKGNSENSQNH